MLGKTHFAGGALVGALIGAAVNQPLIGMGIGAVAALAPDIDEPGSVIGRRLPFLAWPVKLLFGHRTITHTMEFGLFIGFLIGLLIWNWFGLHAGIFIGICIFAGILSHILLDSLTPSGVQPFIFLPWHLKGPFPTGNLLEIILCLAFLISAFKVVS